MKKIKKLSNHVRLPSRTHSLMIVGALVIAGGIITALSTFASGPSSNGSLVLSSPRCEQSCRATKGSVTLTSNAAVQFKIPKHKTGQYTLGIEYQVTNPRPQAEAAASVSIGNQTEEEILPLDEATAYLGEEYSVDQSTRQISLRVGALPAGTALKINGVSLSFSRDRFLDDYDPAVDGPDLAAARQSTKAKRIVRAKKIYNSHPINLQSNPKDNILSATQNKCSKGPRAASGGRICSKLDTNMLLDLLNASKIRPIEISSFVTSTEHKRCSPHYRGKAVDFFAKTSPQIDEGLFRAFTGEKQKFNEGDHLHVGYPGRGPCRA